MAEARQRVKLEDTRGAAPSEDDASSDPPSSSASRKGRAKSNAVSTSFLNPHKAMAGVNNMLSNNAVRLIKGAVGRGLADMPAAPAPAPPPLPQAESPVTTGLPPLGVPRSRSTSRADREHVQRKMRNTSNANYAELERLLGGFGECETRADLVERAVKRIESLQKEVNEAGERNGKLHDYVDGLEDIDAAPTSPLDNAPVQGMQYRDVVWMLLGGLLANLAPAELHEPSAAGLRVTLRGVARILLRAAVACLCAVCAFHTVKGSRVLVDLVRWALLSLVQASPAPEVQKPRGGREGGAPAPSQHPAQRTHVSAHMLGGGGVPQPTVVPSPSGTRVAQLKGGASNMRKIYSAEDFDAMEERFTLQAMTVQGARSRAISNPVLHDSTRRVTLNHHLHNLQSR